MKVSNNALNFLLAQYRAIFKRAYVKGIASAVLLTAGLAVGQAQAATPLTDTQITADPGALANAGEDILIGQDADGKTAKYNKITISGTASTGTSGTWNANVTLNSGATSENYIKGNSGNVNLTGEGSLTIDIIDSEEATNGLSISGDASGSTVKIGNIKVTRGTLAIADGTESVTVSAGNITVGAAPETNPDTPAATAAAPEYSGILKLSSTTNSKNATLGYADSIITVNSTGKIEVTAGSGTASISGASLTLNSNAMFLSQNDGQKDASTSTLAVDNLAELAGAFHIVSGSASHTLTQEFTGKTASFGGNLLITEHATLDLKTKLATGTGDIEGQGTVTLENGSNTVLGGTLKVSSGTLAVADDAQLNASVEKATIAIAETSDSKSTLEISSSTLKQFLDGGNADYQAINTNGTTAKASAPSAKGALTISSGTLRFTDDSVTLSDFGFKGTNDVTSAANVDAGKITFASGSVTNIVGENFTIKKQLDSSTTGANSKIMLKADSLSLGGDAAVDDYGFSGATVANLYNTNTAGDISLGNAVTLDVTVGSDPSTTIPADANGVFSGDFVLDDSTKGELTVAHGHYTHDGSLTISGGTLTVTNGKTDKNIETYLTLDKVILHSDGSAASTIDVNGSDTGVATVLDISEANLEIKAGAGSTSGTITVQSGGTLRTNSDNLLKILNKGTNTKGFAVTLKTGTLEVTEGLELDVKKLHTGSAEEDKIKLDTTNGSNTILVNGELALTNINNALNFDKTEFTAEELTFKMASGQAGPAQLQSGTYTAWSGLDGNNGIEVSGATLLLGGFDKDSDGFWKAKSNGGNIGTTLAIKSGSATIQNGQWTGSSITVSDTGILKIGDDNSSYKNASGETFAAELTTTSLKQSAGSTTVAKTGTLTTDSLTVSNGTFIVNGAMTVNGDYKEEVPGVGGAAGTPASYGVELAAGKLKVGANATLTFGADAVKAITVNKSADASGGLIDIEENTFGAGNDAPAEVIGVDVGSTVTFNFDSGTSFSEAALKEFRKEIFGQETTLDGYINLGSAKIDGLTVENGEVKWSNLQNFIDTNSDYTTELLQEAKVTGITADAELRGSLGSLSSNTLAAGAQIKVDGNLALNNAAGNGGAFASNNTGDVLGLNVTANAQVNLNNGGEIGTVTFSSKGGSFVVESDNTPTTIAAIEGAHASTHFTTGTATVKGETETKQLTTDAGTNTTFVGDVTVGQQAADTDVSTLAGDTTFKGVATFAQDAVVANTGSAHFAGNVDFHGNASLYGDTTVDGIATADKGLKIDQGAVVTINKLITSGDVFVGSVEGEKAGAGTLSVETLRLNGHDLVVDPDWNNEAGLAFVGVNQFYDGTPVDDDAGILNGKAYALQNSILSIGNKDKDDVLAIFDKYINAQGNLSNDKDGVGSIVYVADTVKVATGGKIVADKTKTESTFKPADYTTALFIGDNSVLGVEVSAANGAEAAITFADDVTVDASNSGKIVLTGDYDQSDRIYLMADQNGTGTVTVADNGSIKVETINGLLTYDFDGQAFNISSMKVDTKRAASAFSATSSPVHESLVAYGTGDTAWDERAHNKEATKTHGGVVSGIVFFNNDFYYESEVEGQDPSVRVEDENPELYKSLTTLDVANPDYNPQNPGTEQPYDQVVVYKAYNPLLSAINNVQANSGISAESAARMADFAGVAQVALKAGNSTSDAISGRMGVGAQNSAITYANNGQGAGLWVTPIYMNSDSDGFEAQGISYGTDINLYGVALGGDYTLANGIRVGAMFNVGSGDVDGQGAGSNVSSDFDYYGLGLYAGYTMGQFSIVGDLSYTAVDNDLEANTEFADIGKLETSLDSSNISLGVTGAYAFDTAAGVKVTPHVGLRYSYIDIDDYTVGSKKGAIGSYSADSLSVFSIPVGVTIASEFNAGSWSVKPSFDLTLTGNFGDDENEGTFHWNGVENIDSGLKSEIFDNFTYGATLGVAAQSASGISLGLSVGYTGSSNVDDFGVNANARFTF
ncbi:MAG: autotransporter outer membrane beta-barrel domain-containing protein [Anaerobiospirillum sp.]|nr:autotransporter outer membrane beta-barrel domain-containing protein [Anaerobiospirillum sp.]